MNYYVYVATMYELSMFQRSICYLVHHFNLCWNYLPFLTENGYRWKYFTYFTYFED